MLLKQGLTLKFCSRRLSEIFVFIFQRKLVLTFHESASFIMKMYAVVLVRIASFANLMNAFNKLFYRNYPHLAMINPQQLELPISRTKCHDSKNVRAFVVRLYVTIYTKLQEFISDGF